MANSNFVVKNGLTVGPVTIDAATGNINGIAAANISSIQNGNSNVAITANGNVTINAVGGSRIVATATGANVSGYLNIALGSITAVQPVISKSVTWNNASVTFTALSTSITDTASAAGSNIADWQVGGSSKFSVNKAGNTSVAGTMNVTGNANVGNLGTATAIITTGNITTVNSGLVQNGTSNLSIVGGGNISASVGGTANVAVWTTTGVVLANANVTGYANIGGNANVGNLGTATIIATTANLTTINSGLLQNSTSNVTVTSAGNVSVFVAGNVTARAIFTSTGANIAGTANITGNANVGNLGTAQVLASANITSPQFISNVATGTAPLVVTSTTQVANMNVALAGSATTAGTVTTAAQPNITSTGTLTGLTVNGALSVTAQTTSYQIAPAANATYSLGNSTNYWTTIYGTATTALYADVAELYVADDDYPPGTVLVFGGDHEVTVCNSDMSVSIAGVVSTKPALRMNDQLKSDHTVELALLGRVPTKVVGKVSKGDMMVSTSNGHAMACSAPVIGSVIGKALADFDGTEGVIEVVVGRV
jgi:hypothetical protein